MYRGLFNPQEGLSAQDFHAVGAMTSRLMLPWNQWVHRRVERTQFVDEDVIRRSISVDFTVPYWFHERRGTPLGGARRQLVPLGMLRKGTLVNFSLRDESERSLPLLTTAQNRQVAEAVLVAIGRSVLGGDVPHEVRCDIRQLVATETMQADAAIASLFERRDAASTQRGILRDDPVFRSTAEPFAYNFLALTVCTIGWHERRILHYSYDESLWGNERAGLGALIGMATIGRPRRVLLTVPAVGDADSHHFEVEAPEGLMISTREDYTAYPADKRPVEQISKGGSYQRSHVHFPQAEQGAEAAVLVRLQPRASSILRAGCLAGILAVATILFIRLQLGAIKHASDQGAAAAAVLLAFPGLVSLYVARSDDNAMTTNLLWPVRLVALTPGLAAFLGAAAIVGGSNADPTRIFLWVMLGFAAMSSVLLGNAWRLVVRRGRRH